MASSRVVTSWAEKRWPYSRRILITLRLIPSQLMPREKSQLMPGTTTTMLMVEVCLLLSGLRLFSTREQAHQLSFWKVGPSFTKYGAVENPLETTAQKSTSAKVTIQATTQAPKSTSQLTWHKMSHSNLSLLGSDKWLLMGVECLKQGTMPHLATQIKANQLWSKLISSELDCQTISGIKLWTWSTRLTVLSIKWHAMGQSVVTAPYLTVVALTLAFGAQDTLSKWSLQVMKTTWWFH